MQRRRRTDPRTERTRTVLLKTFVELVLERGYEAVTINDVASRASVGRSTCYVHFPHKRDLLRHSLAAPSMQLVRALDARVEPAALLPQLRHFHANRTRNRVFLLQPIRAVWVGFLADLIEARLQTAVGPSGRVPRLPRRLAALHMAESQLALISHWLLEHPECSEQAVAAALIASARAFQGSSLVRN